MPRIAAGRRLALVAITLAGAAAFLAARATLHVDVGALVLRRVPPDGKLDASPGMP